MTSEELNVKVAELRVEYDPETSFLSTRPNNNIEIWYSVSKKRFDGFRIDAVKVYKEMDEHVWINGKKLSKETWLGDDSCYMCFFKGFEEAKEFAVGRASNLVKVLEREIEIVRLIHKELKDKTIEDVEKSILL